MTRSQKISFVLVLLFLTFAGLEITSIYKEGPVEIIDSNKLNEMVENNEEANSQKAGPQKPGNTNNGQISGKVTLKTNAGDIKLQLFPTEAPKTVENFINLASSGFYNGTKFHRIIKDFMIQGGDPLSKDNSQKSKWGTGGPGYSFEDEFSEKLSNVPGTISMANSGPNTNGSQFFINVAQNTFLDGKHSVFGQVIEGGEVVMGISGVETDANDAPLQDIIIQEIIIE